MTVMKKARGVKACPFCGNKELLITGKRYYDSCSDRCGAMEIECRECKMSKWSFPHAEMSYAEASKLVIKGWNRRAAS